MKTIYVTEQTDDNTKIWYLTDCGDLIEADEREDYPGAITAKVVSHGIFPGSLSDWKRSVLESALCESL